MTFQFHISFFTGAFSYQTKSFPRVTRQFRLKYGNNVLFVPQWLPNTKRAGLGDPGKLGGVKQAKNLLSSHCLVHMKVLK